MSMCWVSIKQHLSCLCAVVGTWILTGKHVCCIFVMCRFTAACWFYCWQVENTVACGGRQESFWIDGHSPQTWCQGNAMVLWLFMPVPNVVWPEAYCFCPVRPCVHLCVHLETLLTHYLAEYLTHFHQTYISNVLWDRDETLHSLGSKVKVTME